MINNNLRNYLFTLLFFIFLTTPLLALEDAIIAVVNDDLITLKDFQEFLNAIYLQLKASKKSPEEIQSIMADLEENGINRLIDNKILVSEANRLGLEIRSEAIEGKITEIRKQYPTEEVFMNALIEDGMNLSDLKNKISDQMRANYIVDKEVKSKIFVNPQEVTAYYQKNRTEFHDPERVNLDSIYIPFQNEAESARKNAAEAYRQIKEGMDFREVAKTYSRAQPLGVMIKGQMIPAIEKEVFKLAVGEISSIIEVENGLYLFKILGRSPGKIAKLDEVKDKIKDRIFQEKFQKKVNEWIDQLREKSYIEIKE